MKNKQKISKKFAGQRKFVNGQECEIDCETNLVYIDERV